MKSCLRGYSHKRAALCNNKFILSIATLCKDAYAFVYFSQSQLLYTVYYQHLSQDCEDVVCSSFNTLSTLKCTLSACVLLTLKWLLNFLTQIEIEISAFY